MRFLFYSHDGMGLGHVRRHLAIASALVELAPEARILLATSVEEVSHLGLPSNVDTLKLPGLRKVAGNQYSSRRLGLGLSEIRSLRAALLNAAVSSFRPAVVLADKHAFGAAGELEPALKSARASGACAVLGLRDILDEPGAVQKEWARDGIRERLLDYYEQVLVYGHQSIFDPIVQYSFPPALAERTHFTGYVLHESSCNAGCDEPGAKDVHRRQRFQNPGLKRVRKPTVLAAAGGGEDGFALLKTFLETAKDAPWKSLAVTGPMLSKAEASDLKRLAAEAKVPLETFVPKIWELFDTAACLVCMGGYNTLVEAVSKGIPVVCVPRVSPRSEQLLRARLFEQLGLLRVLHPEELSAGNLRNQMTLALATARDEIRQRTGAVLHFDGAARTARFLVALAGKRRPRHERLMAERTAGLDYRLDPVARF